MQIRPSTGTVDQKESLSLSLHTTNDKLPAEDVCSGFTAAAKAFMGKCQALSLQLLGCFAQSLQLPEGFFTLVQSPTYLPCAFASRMENQKVP